MKHRYPSYGADVLGKSRPRAAADRDDHIVLMRGIATPQPTEGNMED